MLSAPLIAITARSWAGRSRYGPGQVRRSDGRNCEMSAAVAATHFLPVCRIRCPQMWVEEEGQWQRRQHKGSEAGKRQWDTDAVAQRAEHEWRCAAGRTSERVKSPNARACRSDRANSPRCHRARMKCR